MALRILLADDSMTAQNMGKKILTEAGYQVLTVSNGAAAVKKLAEWLPDLAIVDVYMPGYSGLEVCERIKSASATARTPVLLSVGKMEPFRPEDGMKVKADGVIIKPFEATDLVTVVDKLAERTYGTSRASAVTPVAPPAPEPLAPAASTPLHSEPPSVGQQFVVDDDSEPVFAPAGLQTFEPSPEVEAPIEPRVEFTAAAAVEVAPQQITGLEPTVLQDVIPADNATEDALETFQIDVAEPTTTFNDTEDLDLLGNFAASPLEPADNPNASFDLPTKNVANSEEPTDEPLSAVAPQAEHPVWEAEEAELTEHDLAIDLEAEMRAHAQASQPVAVPDQPSTGEDQALAAAAGATGLSSQLGVPLLAPIGKTSYDEFDSVMAEAASRFEASVKIPDFVEESAADEQVVDTRTDEEVLAGVATLPELVVGPTEASVEFELESSRAMQDVSATGGQPQVELADVFDSVAPEAEAISDDSGLLADLISEEREEPSFTTTASSMKSADALSGVFEMDAVQAPAPVEVPEVAAEQTTVDSALAPTPSAEEVFASIVPERVGKDLFLYSYSGEPVADTAADTQAAASQKAMQETGQVVASDADAFNTLVERVVDRVLDRLKPILVVTVEEIVRELKK
ncbi:MAG TPA: response regulator [Terriglobales bacterium]|nr:response regulator [Terriglobales bacterium]